MGGAVPVLTGSRLVMMKARPTRTALWRSCRLGPGRPISQSGTATPCESRGGDRLILDYRVAEEGVIEIIRMPHERRNRAVTSTNLLTERDI